MADTNLSPLSWNVPIVDPQTGYPSIYFQTMIQQWLDEKAAFEDAAITLDALGGDPGADRGVFWDDSATAFAFLEFLSTFFTITGTQLTLADNGVSDAKLRDSAALSVIGRSANSTGDPADIAAANDAEVLRRSGTALGFGTVATAGIANDAVTNAKLANMAASLIKARKINSTGDPEDCTLSEILDFIGSTAQGDILYRGASAWARLAAGASGQVLTTGGAAANPSWAGANSAATVYAKNTSTLNGTPSTSAFASKGHAITPLYAMSIISVWFGFTPVNAATYIVHLLEVGADLTVDVVTGATASRTGLGTTNKLFKFDFATPVSLVANLRYVLVITRTDNITTYVLPINASSSNAHVVGLPFSVDINTVRLATVGPGVGSVYVDTGSAGSYEFALVGNFTP